MGSIKKLGTLYMGNLVVRPNRKYNGKILALGNTTEESELSWINVNGLLVSDHVYCLGINWNQFNQWGFISGKRVTIDGNPYFCRSLKVGDSADDKNDWDTILDITGEDNELWNWRRVRFWGQDSGNRGHAVRGSKSARYWGFYWSHQIIEDIGIRPVLDPLSLGSQLSELLIGSRIKVYGPEGLPVAGIVRDISDYDLFLSPNKKQPRLLNSSWCYRQDDGIIIMDRGTIAFAEEERKL